MMMRWRTQNVEMTAGSGRIGWIEGLQVNAGQASGEPDWSG